MRLKSADFWRLTPAQFFAIADRAKIDIYRADQRSGIISATIANVHRGKNDPSYKPKDFMPAGTIEETEVQSPENLLLRFQLITGAPPVNG